MRSSRQLRHRRLPAVLCGAVLLAAAPGGAAAEETRAAATLGHHRQFGVHAQAGAGYRVLFPYHSEFCGVAGESVCVGRSPVFLELGASYGVSRSIELLVDVRLGLEEDFRSSSTGPAPRALALAPGIKVYVDDEGRAKFFSTLQAALDFTDYTASGVEDGVDVGVRNVNGVHVDLTRNVGLYLHFGMTIGVLRWLRFEPDGGLGVQARFP